MAKKVPGSQRLSTSDLKKGIFKISMQEYQGELKSLFVPEHLLCVISGCIMKDPVTLMSGRSFEKDAIKHYFDVQRENAQKFFERHDEDE